MLFISEIILNYRIELVLGLLVTSLVLIIWQVINQFRIANITKKYNRLIEGVTAGSLETMLLQHLDEVREVKDDLIEVKHYCNELDSRLKLAVQRVGIVRYNAFSDMGSDLSFSIALLDENSNGFVISSIFGRNECNTYAKPISNGKSKYTLSVEELQAIDRAKQNSLAMSTKAKIS